MYSALVLFDIDGTLLKLPESISAHKKAFSVAFEKVYNIKTDINRAEGPGKSDWQIAIEALEFAGLSEKQVNNKINVFNTEIVICFKKLLEKEPVNLLPGAKELLIELKKRNCLLGIVTGNVEGIAKAKLDSLNISDFFVLGGYGNQARTRTKVIGKAIQKARQLDFNENNVFVFDDAPIGIQAAKEHNAIAIAVLTGRYSSLKEFNPDFEFKNLENTNEILKAMNLK